MTSVRGGFAAFFAFMGLYVILMGISITWGAFESVSASSGVPIVIAGVVICTMGWAMLVRILKN